MWTFDSFNMIFAGLLTGIVFGLLLQRAHVTRYKVILGQFLFTDFTVLKVMLTAIVVGAIGIWAMLQMDMIDGLHVKNAALAGTVVGGVIFGVGMAILGYCPGTGVAALGDGSRHVIPGILGMVVGAGVFAEVYPLISDNLLQWFMVEAVIDGKATSKLTFVDMTGLTPWFFIVGMAVVAAVLFWAIERREHRRPPVSGSA